MINYTAFVMQTCGRNGYGLTAMLLQCKHYDLCEVAVSVPQHAESAASYNIVQVLSWICFF